MEYTISSYVVEVVDEGYFVLRIKNELLHFTTPIHFRFNCVYLWRWKNCPADASASGASDPEAVVVVTKKRGGLFLRWFV